MEKHQSVLNQSRKQNPGKEGSWTQQEWLRKAYDLLLSWKYPGQNLELCWRGPGVHCESIS